MQLVFELQHRVAHLQSRQKRVHVEIHTEMPDNGQVQPLTTAEYKSGAMHEVVGYAGREYTHVASHCCSTVLQKYHDINYPSISERHRTLKDLAFGAVANAACITLHLLPNFARRRLSRFISSDLKMWEA